METVSVSFKKGDQRVASVPDAGGEVFVVFTEGNKFPQAISIPGCNEPLELNHVSFAERTGTAAEELPSTGQHDIYFDDEHAEMPEENTHVEGEEESGGRASSMHDSHRVLLVPYFGHPTSEWRPK